MVSLLPIISIVFYYSLLSFVYSHVIKQTSWLRLIRNTVCEKSWTFKLYFVFVI